MTGEQGGKSLFIVDNSVSGWTALQYLKDWTEIAKAFDIATGYFEISSLLALDGNWQKLGKIRILLGAEVSSTTKKALLEAVQKKTVTVLADSLERSKDDNPFLEGVPAILAALRSGQIECRIYNKGKFHAKAYITHAKLDVVGSQALVGSSNFTWPGLTDNIELNIQVQSSREVAQLQEWYETHWAQGVDATEAVAVAVERHIREYLPFDVYAKALQEYFRGHELTATEWDETQSKMFKRLDRYQKEAYWALMKIVTQHGGAFLCDGVGLGKTFVGLMIIERMVLKEGKRVVLFAPKSARESVWDPHIKRWLGHIGGGVFSNLIVFNHTDLGRGNGFSEQFERVAELADVVVIDEAHYFRNPGKLGNPEKGIEPSRYHRLREILAKAERPKQLVMLTATPINNSLADFKHMIELFTGEDSQYFAQTLGVNNLTSHFVQMDKNLRAAVKHEVSDLQDDLFEAHKILEADAIFQELVVQRSRAYARESQLREAGAAAAFPERKPPQVAAYSVKKSYGRLLTMFEEAFAKDNPLFTLPMYYPLHWYKGPDQDIDGKAENRQQQVVSLIRTNFLKRFESSVAAFILSCERLTKKLVGFLEVHAETPDEKKRLERWLRNNADALGLPHQREKELWDFEGDDDELEEEDFVPADVLADIEKNRLSRDEYDVPAMISETFLDLDEIAKFLRESNAFQPKNDDKLQKLIRLLQLKEHAGQKFLIFTEFAETARYLKSQLLAAGIDGVFGIDSGTKGSRRDVIERFSPYYNESSSAQLAKQGRQEIRVLISTDVLSEGLNLQDASRMINYDIHWNPVRLMQRIGRVDRRMNPGVEALLVTDHPEVQASRGKVWFWNFLPPEELNSLLSLYRTVTQKTLLISMTLGIEGKKLLTPDDDFAALKEFNQAYEGSKTAVEEMHLEYQEMIRNDPGLEAQIAALPGSVFSGKALTAPGSTGVFFCYALPALDKATGEFSVEAGPVRWYFCDLVTGKITEDAGEIVGLIRSTPETPRRCLVNRTKLVELRKVIDTKIKNEYLKRLNAPVGVKPILRCWMEVNQEN